MDHELMTRINQEAHEKEQRKFEHAKAAVARLETKRKVRLVRRRLPFFEVKLWDRPACQSKSVGHTKSSANQSKA